MEREKLLKIIEFNTKYAKEIQADCSYFYSLLRRDSAVLIPDIQVISEVLFRDTGYKLIRIPLKSEEIGAFQLKLNGLKYIVLNTAKNVAYNNFALAHELYHTLIQEDVAWDSAELYMDGYDENIYEMRANAFAGNILMPKEDFNTTADLIRQMSEKVVEDLDEDIIDLLIIITLMNNYKTTYMSVVIRCYEMGFLPASDSCKMDFLLSKNSEEDLKEVFRETSKYVPMNWIMEPTRVDDFQNIINEAKREGKKNVEEGFITEADYNYRIKGLQDAYKRVVEG